MAGIVFAESGLLVGFFLPGDSLLFTAGFLASQHTLNIFALALACFVAAVIGDSVGYNIGKRMGPRLLKRPDGKIFKKQHIAQAEEFYKKHGKKTIIIARFTPIVRTFAPIVAGLGNMEYKSFLAYNVAGSALWTFSLTYAGYYLGKALPNVSHYLEPVILLVILLSLSPAFYHFFKNAENRKKLKRLPRSILSAINKKTR